MERGTQTEPIQPEAGTAPLPEEQAQKKSFIESVHDQLGVKLQQEQDIPPVPPMPQVSPEPQLPKIEKISFVDVTQLAESEARDVAEENLTAKKESLKGIKGWWKKVWDHNILREYNRQKEIARVKGEIYHDENIYAGVDDDEKHHRAAMAAITQRFLSEYDLVREDSGEARKNLNEISDAESAEKEVLKDEIKKMIMDYATAENPSDELFEAARYRVLEKVTKLGKGVVEEGKMYADNLRTVAEQVRMSLVHNKGLQELDFELDISLGRATSGVRTEANYNKVDKIIEKVQKSKIGSLLANETAIASAVAIAASVAPKMATSTLRGAAKAFGLGAAVSGLVVGAKENRRLKLERAQHARGMAKGGNIDEKNSPRRNQLEQYRYETSSATELKNDLLSHLYTEGNPEKGVVTLTPDQFEDALHTVSQIEGRINLSNKEGIDLISYSDVTKVEIERTSLEIELARAKVALKKMYETNPALQGETNKGTFENQLKDYTGAYEKQTSDNEIRNKDRKFNKMKAGKVAFAAVKGAVNSMVVGGVVGAVGQEIRSAFDPKLEGVVEHYVSGHSHTATHDTMLEQLRGYIFGNPHETAVDAKLADVPGWHNAHEHIQFPEGTQVIEGNNDTVTIIDPSGKTIAENIPFKFNGDDLTEETRKAFEEHHISFIGTESHTIDGGTTPVETSPDEYVQNHSENLHTIKRDMWYDNDTNKVFDKNELGTRWGGVNGSGVDEQGNYVFNIAHMDKDGSYHGEFSANAKELIKNGGLKMALSMSHDTQHEVFEVPVDADGNIRIDPNSEAGKLLFKTVDGKAVFMGRYAEVDQMMATGPDGEHVRMLSTVEGPGIEKIPDTIPTTDTETIRRFTFDTEETPRDWTIPPAIPLMGRTPLEPLGREKPKDEPTPQPRPVAEQPKPAPTIEAPTVEVPIVEPKQENIEEPKSEEPKQPIKQEIPNGGWMAEGPKETSGISQEEYDALRDDINLINKKVQANEGIVTVNEDSFKSKFAKDLYKELEHMKPGIPVQFNRTELRTMGDKIEKRLMESKIDRSLDKLMLTQDEYEDLVDDIKFINKKVQSNEGIVTVEEGDLQSAFGKKKYNEMKNIKPGIPVQFNKTELREIGDLMENGILAGSKVATSARDIEIMRNQRGSSFNEVPVREKKEPAPQQQPINATISTPAPEAQPLAPTPTPEQQQPVVENEEEIAEDEDLEDQKAEETVMQTPAVETLEQKGEQKKDEGMVYQEYPKKYTVNENFIGVANAKETNNPAGAILTIDPVTKRALPYKEGWEALLRSTKGDAFFLERALRPFFNYTLKVADFGTHFEKLRFTPAEIDPTTGMVIKKGEIKIFDDGSPLIKTPISNI